MLFFSGLLNFNGPLKDRPLLANGEENEDYDEEEEEDNKGDEDEENPHQEERAVRVCDSSSVEDHIMDHLPPTLHKGKKTT